MNKLELTRLFLDQASLPSDPKSTKQYRLLWWVAPFSPYGLKLTTEGHVFLDNVLKLEKYSCSIKAGTPNTLKIMSQMNKYLSSPFYIRGNTIFFYGETDAIMLALHAGDIAQYLENFASTT